MSGVQKQILKRKRGGEEENEEGKEGKAVATRPPYKQRVLVLSSRGITQRQRHLMGDLSDLLPHSKKGVCFHLLIHNARS